MSDDAGRYLCEYIYFRSMKQSTESGVPVLFCHVPSDGKPYSIHEMTAIILCLVSLLVDMSHTRSQEVQANGTF